MDNTSKVAIEKKRLTVTIAGNSKTLNYDGREHVVLDAQYYENLKARLKGKSEEADKFYGTALENKKVADSLSEEVAKLSAVNANLDGQLISVNTELENTQTQLSEQRLELEHSYTNNKQLVAKVDSLQKELVAVRSFNKGSDKQKPISLSNNQVDTSKVEDEDSIVMGTVTFKGDKCFLIKVEGYDLLTTHHETLNVNYNELSATLDLESHKRHDLQLEVTKLRDRVGKAEARNNELKRERDTVRKENRSLLRHKRRADESTVNKINFIANHEREEVVGTITLGEDFCVVVPKALYEEGFKEQAETIKRLKATCEKQTIVIGQNNKQIDSIKNNHERKVAGLHGKIKEQQACIETVETKLAKTKKKLKGSRKQVSLLRGQFHNNNLVPFEFYESEDEDIIGQFKFNDGTIGVAYEQSYHEEVGNMLHVQQVEIKDLLKAKDKLQTKVTKLQKNLKKKDSRLKAVVNKQVSLLETPIINVELPVVSVKDSSEVEGVTLLHVPQDQFDELYNFACAQTKQVAHLKRSVKEVNNNFNFLHDALCCLFNHLTNMKEGGQYSIQSLKQFRDGIKEEVSYSVKVSLERLLGIENYLNELYTASKNTTTVVDEEDEKALTFGINCLYKYVNHVSAVSNSNEDFDFSTLESINDLQKTLTLDFSQKYSFKQLENIETMVDDLYTRWKVLKEKQASKDDVKDVLGQIQIAIKTLKED